jgi:hypothetical protein
MKRALWWSLLLVACGTPETPPPAEPPTQPAATPAPAPAAAPGAEGVGWTAPD